jgi:hypothetical protein
MWIKRFGQVKSMWKRCESAVELYATMSDAAMFSTEGIERRRGFPKPVHGVLFVESAISRLFHSV